MKTQASECPSCTFPLRIEFDGHQSYIVCDKCRFEGLYCDGPIYNEVNPPLAQPAEKK